MSQAAAAGVAHRPAALAVEIPALPQVSDADLAAPLEALLRRWPGADG